MKPKLNLFTIIGMQIHTACNVIDRIVYDIPCFIAIPIYVMGIICLFIGLVKTRNEHYRKDVK